MIEKLRGDEAVKLEQVWYMLLTEKDYYNNCKFVNNYVLMFLDRSFNECIAESEGVKRGGYLDKQSTPER